MAKGTVLLKDDLSPVGISRQRSLACRLPRRAENNEKKKAGGERAPV
jgi:hypothetical protein